MKNPGIKNRVVLVTGAGNGLGRAYAVLLGDLGASVVVNDVDSSKNDAGLTPAEDCAAQIIKRGGSAIHDGSSVACATGARTMVQAAVDHFGKLDAVVNNAGVFFNQSFEATEVEDYERLLNVNFLGTVLVTRAAWPQLKTSIAGRVVNTVSSGIFGLENCTAYSAAKAAILGFTKSLAQEARQTNIRVNAISPGAATGMTMGSNMDEDFVRWIKQTLPASVVAPVVAYLVDPRCDSNGEIFASQGGLTYRYLMGGTGGHFLNESTVAEVINNIEKILDPGGFKVFQNTQELVENDQAKSENRGH